MLRTLLFYVFKIQVNCLNTGYRSVPLRNKYSEEYELATLLIHISIRNGEVNGNPSFFH